MADIYAKQSPDEIRETIEANKRDNKFSKASYDVAIQYIDGHMLDDTEWQLDERFPEAQKGDPGQRIYPQTLPLAKRYVDEAASAYDRAVSRKLKLPDGEESEATMEATKVLNDELASVLFDDTMHKLDRIQNIVHSCGAWPQQKRGKLSMQLVLPQNCWPLRPTDGRMIDVGNQEDYQAFLIELINEEVNNTNSEKRDFAYVSRSQVALYKGAEDKLNTKSELTVHNNVFTWPQVPDTDPTMKPPAPQELPLMPVVWWHLTQPTNGILPQLDVNIVDVNRELNVHWSVLMDTFRFQGFDTPVYKSEDPAGVQSRQRHGARFPKVVGLLEDYTYEHSAADYTSMVNMLVMMQRNVALMHRMSPNDFSPEASAAVSGFAKLVDSLPKLEARENRLRRLKFMEEEVLWPRIASIMIWLGVLPQEAKTWKLEVQFQDLEIPKTPDEIAKELEVDFKHNLSTPAHVYAKRHDITVDEAKLEILKNQEINNELKANAPEPQAQPQSSPFGGFGLGGRIGRRDSRENDGEDDRSTS